MVICRLMSKLTLSVDWSFFGILYSSSNSMDLSTSIVDSLALNSALAVFHMQCIDLLDVLSSVEV